MEQQFAVHELLPVSECLTLFVLSSGTEELVRVNLQGTDSVARLKVNSFAGNLSWKHQQQNFKLFHVRRSNGLGCNGMS